MAGKMKSLSADLGTKIVGLTNIVDHLSQAKKLVDTIVNEDAEEAAPEVEEA